MATHPVMLWSHIKWCYVHTSNAVMAKNINFQFKGNSKYNEPGGEIMESHVSLYTIEFNLTLIHFLSLEDCFDPWTSSSASSAGPWPRSSGPPCSAPCPCALPRCSTEMQDWGQVPKDIYDRWIQVIYRLRFLLRGKNFMRWTMAAVLWAPCLAHCSFTTMLF